MAFGMFDQQPFSLGRGLSGEFSWQRGGPNTGFRDLGRRLSQWWRGREALGNLSGTATGMPQYQPNVSRGAPAMDAMRLDAINKNQSRPMLPVSNMPQDLSNADDMRAAYFAKHQPLMPMNKPRGRNFGGRL